MVLVDTSVWIRAFAGRAPYRDGVDELLRQDLVAAHPFVLGELLIGDKGGRRGFLQEYARYHKAQSVPNDEVVEFVGARSLNGRGLTWIDAHLLASALVDRFWLWSADEYLAAIAEQIGIAYRP